MYYRSGLNDNTKWGAWVKLLDTGNSYVTNGKGVINGTTITQVENATNATNSTNARKLVNWYSARPTSLNTQFGDGSLRIFYATSSTTEGKSPDDATVLHLAWDNNGGWDSQLAVSIPSSRVYSRSQNGGTWQPWKTLAFTTDIPTSLKNPHSLTLKANGTTLAIYDGSSVKEANFTYANVGAASANHTHSYYAVNENYGGFKKAERLPTSGFYQSYISDKEESGGNAPWKSWVHLINCQYSNTGNNYAL
nr:MAG TPA: tail fiber protein [Bacteriophage sp.]